LGETFLLSLERSFRSPRQNDKGTTLVVLPIVGDQDARADARRTVKMKTFRLAHAHCAPIETLVTSKNATMPGVV
jgi:hypothetical protein